jgi:arginine exporter protein ArgO
MLFGVVFLLVGVAGFIPGITTEYDRIDVFDGEGALLLGLFGVNILESVVHLGYGAWGLAAARRADASRMFFLVGGAIYIALWIYGLVIDLNSSANFIGINEAANWLHFALGVVMLGIGLILGRDMTNRTVDGR